MKRRDFLGSLAIGGLSTRLAHSAPALETPCLIRTPPVLMAPRGDGIEVVWSVSRLSRGWVEWESASGETGQAGADPFGFVPQGDKVLRVRVSGLQPGKEYRVRSHTAAVSDEERATSAWKTFRTLNASGTETRFVMWNDTHIQDDTIRALHAATPAADFLVWNGDTCNDWTKDEILVPTLLNPGGCDISERRPLLIVWGNHDSRGPYAFQMPSVVATPSQRPFYAFRSGPVAVICLHTGEDKPDDHPSFSGRVAFDALRSEQAQWLQGVIEEPEMKQAPYRVVFCHIPLRWKDESPQDYSAKGFDRHSGRSRAAWHDALVKWKTQVILSGHTHQTFWMPPTDPFPYGQLIGGGPRMPDATWIEGVADGRELRLTARNLSGRMLHDIQLKPVA